MARLRTSSPVVIGAVAVLLALVITLTLPLTMPWVFDHIIWGDPFDDQAFDRAVWLTARANPNPKNPRGPMAEAAQRLVTKGMTRPQVEAILGVADGSFRQGSETEEWYNLGTWGALTMDGDALFIEYGGDGRVRETAIGDK